MIRVRTGRLLIRNFAPDDWRDLRDIIIDKESTGYAIYDHAFPTSEDEVKHIADWFAGGDDFLAVIELSSSKVIGYLAVNGEAQTEKNLGFTFHSTYQKKGFAAEACREMIKYAFMVMRLDRLTSGTANLNKPAYSLLSKLGFRKIGESITSFRKTPEGRPIEFIGSSFVLERDEWIERDIGRDM